MKNKRAPKELARYVVHVSEKTPAALKETYFYGRTQKELKERVKGKAGKKQMYKVIYDYIGEVK